MRLVAYVPYQMWTEADPRVMSLIQGSLRNYRHELLLGNAETIPIMQQHGAVDTNVPAFHSRRMRQITSQSKINCSSEYVELKGKGHWFEGVMTTSPLRKFYSEILEGGAASPPLSRSFKIVVANPADMEARGGLVVDQLYDPDQLGKIAVTRDDEAATWTLATSNIRRFHYWHRSANVLPNFFSVDSKHFQLPSGENRQRTWFVLSDDGSWQVSICASVMA